LGFSLESRLPRNKFWATDMMRTTRSIAKTFCVDLEPELKVHVPRKKSSPRPGGAGRVRYNSDFIIWLIYRSRKAANNPWGNRGRKKCVACRTRKRKVYPISITC
jgi:hypothetical protein